jgi:hypothetical protein
MWAQYVCKNSVIQYNVTTGGVQQLEWEAGEVTAASATITKGIPAVRPSIGHDHDDQKKKRRENGQVRRNIRKAGQGR